MGFFRFLVWGCCIGAFIAYMAGTNPLPWLKGAVYMGVPIMAPAVVLWFLRQKKVRKGTQ